MSTMNSKYVDILGDLLAKREYNKAKTLVLNTAYAPVIRDHCMEVTAVVGAHLNEGDVKWSRDLEECCEFALLQVAQLANPKEALLGFLEQVESFGSSKKFKILLLPIQAVLLRMPTKRLGTLNWVLRALESHVRVLALSKASNLEGQQRKLLDGDPNVQIIADIYEAIIEFYRPLVNEVALRKQVSPEEAPARRSMLSNNLIRLMDKPLVFMDIHRELNEAPSLLYTSATKLVSYLCQLKGDLLSLLDEDLHHQRLSPMAYHHKSESQEEPEKDMEQASTLAKAMFFYLIYGEGLGSRHVPCVYHNLYVFHESLRWTLILLRNKNELVLYKGLLLLRESLVRLADLTVDSPCLEFSGHCTVSQELMNVMLYCNVQEFRELALHCFTSHVRKFTLAGRQKMLKMLLTMDLHPGVKAVIVNMVKENIHLCLDQNRDEFLQEPFHTLASLIFPLAEGAVTDLLKQYDDIMATINLARYILLRDQDDRTGFKQIIPTFEQQFLEPLTSALQLSRAHYQLDLNLAKEGKPRDLEVTVNGWAPQLPLSQQKDVLEAAITSFDLMESLLGRVQELLAASKAVQFCERLIHDEAKIRSEDNVEAEKQEIIEEESVEGDTQYEESIKQRVLNAALPFIPQMGWSKESLAAGAHTLGYPGIIHGVFPEGGVALAHHFYRKCNSDLALILERKKKEEGNVRTMAFVGEAVETRLKMNVQFMDQWAEALALMGMPSNAPRSLKLLAMLVDDIWYHAGDTAADFSWYTKRAMLVGVYQATELHMVQDKSVEFAATWEFLDRRMQDFKNIRRGVQSSHDATSFLRSSFETAKNIMGYNARRR